MFYLDGSAEKHGIDKATLKQMVEAVIREREKAAKQEQAERQQAEQRAERQHREEQAAKAKADKDAAKEAERGEKEKQKALAAILKAPQSEHEGRLAELAKQVGEDIELLRDEFAALIDSEEEIKLGGEIELWPEPVNPRELLAELEKQVERYVIIHEEHARVAVMLWIVFAWCHEVATYSPLLIIQGPDADSGKSLLSQVIGLLTPRARIIAEPTGPTMYRYVDRYCPTLIVDNANRLLPRRPDLASIINASWTRGVTIPRPGINNEMFEFDPFCPKVLNGVDVLTALDKETQTRCITVQMWPKLPGENVTHFKFAKADERFAELRQKMARFAADHMQALADTNPPLPASFNNRLAMNWELLLAIADHAAGEWSKRHARQRSSSPASATSRAKASACCGRFRLCSLNTDAS
jgi:hypothetical protein